MSTRFSVRDNHLVMTGPDDNHDCLDSLTRLYYLTQEISEHDRVHEAVQTERISIKMVCNFSGKSWDMLNQNNFEAVRQAVANILNNDECVNVPYIIMKRDDKETLVCQLSILGEKRRPCWKVVRANDFSWNELAYFVNSLKKASVYFYAFHTKNYPS